LTHAASRKSQTTPKVLVSLTGLSGTRAPASESEGDMSMYMHYQGRAVEISDRVVKGRQIPRLYPGDQGEKWGDFAVVDDEIVFWDGNRWLPALNRLAIASNT
jgi:hypothetical protein